MHTNTHTRVCFSGTSTPETTETNCERENSLQNYGDQSEQNDQGGHAHHRDLDAQHGVGAAVVLVGIYRRSDSRCLISLAVLSGAGGRASVVKTSESVNYESLLSP